MRSHLLVMVTVHFLPRIVQAQFWCVPGAEWSHYYSYTDQATDLTEVGILDSRYIGDTMVNGQVCQRIVHDYFYDVQGGPQDQHRSGNPTVTRIEDGVVLILSPFSGQFDTLLWLGAEPGDHWKVYSANARWLVGAVDTVEMDGVQLRRMAAPWVNMTTFSQIRSDTIYERIGPEWSFVFYPANVFVGFQHFDLRCYRDHEMQWTRGAGFTCQFPTTIEPVRDDEAGPIFPNPGSDHLNVRVRERSVAEVWVTDAMGRTVVRGTTLEGKASLNTAHWPSGVYHVRLTNEDAHGWHRWVKQ